MRRVIMVDVITAAGFVCLQRLTAEIIGKSKKKSEIEGVIDFFFLFLGFLW